MPRKKQIAEEIKGPQPTTDIVQTVVSTHVLGTITADALIEEHFRNDDWLTAESRRFQEHIKPVIDRQEAIKNQLLDKLNNDGLDKFSTDHGTAYKSRILNTKIDAEGEPYVRADADHREEFRGREALLEFALDHWDEIGNELLMINAQKDAVKNYMEEHGKPPPGITTSVFTRLNIRRS